MRHNRRFTNSLHSVEYSNANKKKEAQTQFNRTLRIEMHKNIARSRLSHRISKRSIESLLDLSDLTKNKYGNTFSR